MNMRNKLEELRSNSTQLYDEHVRVFSKLRDERKRQNLSQSELAEKIGVSKVTMCRWETGKSHPQPLHYRALCTVLGISFEELFSEELEKSYIGKTKVTASLILTQSNRLKQVRQQHKLSQEELAKAIHAKRGSVNRWECGKGTPNLPHLRKLCQVLGVSPEVLFPDLPTLGETEDIEIYPPVVHNSRQHFFDY